MVWPFQQKRLLYALGLVCLLVAAGGAYWYLKSTDSQFLSPKKYDLTTKLSELAKRKGSSADTSHIAPGVMPPTNSWVSGAVLQAQPQPVFPMPLSLKLSDTGYEMSVPTVNASGNTATAPHIAAVTTNIETNATGAFRQDISDASVRDEDRRRVRQLDDRSRVSVYVLSSIFGAHRYAQNDRERDLAVHQNGEVQKRFYRVRRDHPRSRNLHKG